MIIFRIIFNLFHMVTRLLFLPVHLLMHNMYLVLIVIALIVIYSAFSGGSSTPAGNHPGPIATPEASQVNPAAAPGIIEAVRKHQDGDSAFATDLYASMTEAERGYYSAMFYSVMTNVTDNKPYIWQNVNTAGTIIPTRTFLTSENITCRDFKETLKVHMIEQTLTGIACPQADGSWCKLKPNATPSCGLGGNHGSIFDSIRGLF